MSTKKKKPAPAPKSDFQRACEEADALIDVVEAKIKTLGAEVEIADDEMIGRYRVGPRAECGYVLGYEPSLVHCVSGSMTPVKQWFVVLTKVEILDVSDGDQLCDDGQIAHLRDERNFASRAGDRVVTCLLRQAPLFVKLPAVARLPFFFDEYKRRVEELVGGVRDAARSLKAGGK